jgi:hypothetical protein
MHRVDVLETTGNRLDRFDQIAQQRMLSIAACASSRFAARAAKKICVTSVRWPSFALHSAAFIKSTAMCVYCPSMSGVRRDRATISHPGLREDA